MFAPAFSPTKRQLGAYQQVHVTTGVDGASPHRLVQMLFEGLLDSLARARGAMAHGNVAVKGEEIGRAVRIVEEGLKAGLNVEEGGQLARDLHDLYAYVTVRLTYANLRNDEAAIVECVKLIEPIATAWDEIAQKAAA
ncbi:flagellar export chaperone FliS [Rhizobacter sp. J219]|jgi:flagellar protein FliS|uniref:flagellar export chaperone FliS n=1 Tax=Rhizobacter sp. J219 TaxID=2898430 RepID=UPI002150FD79|nr:flagellar export chaperone FliS [Rhizobacter sp. J219]MCR5885971.1 flagellar export chaperone FliS [Rhizobacter sp. J219]